MNRLVNLAESLEEEPSEVVRMLINEATFSVGKTAERRQKDGRKTAERRQKLAKPTPNPSRRRASSPSGKNKNNTTTNSLSKTPTPKSGENSDKDAGEPKAEKETPPRLNHKFFVGLLGTFGEEHPEYLTEAVKAAWSEFVTHRQSLGANKTFGTKTGALGVLRKLHKLSSKMKDPAARAVELLLVATEMRWMTVFEPKEEASVAEGADDLWQETLRRNMQG